MALMTRLPPIMTPALKSAPLADTAPAAVSVPHDAGAR